jgi:ABC-type branched-subunit amino acid transport system substrate-binding protein
VKHCLLLLIASILIASTSYADRENLKISYITDTTGPGAYHGVAGKLGAELAASELTKSGIPVEVIFGEHSGKPAQAVSEVQNAIQLRQVDAIVTEFSSATNAAVDIVTNSKVQFVGACGSSKFLQRNEFALKTSIEFDTGCKSLVEKFEQTGRNKILVLAANAEFGEWCIEGAKSADNSIQVVRFNLGDDLRTSVTKIVHDGYDSIVVAGLDEDTLQVLRYLANFNSSIAVGTNQAVLSAGGVKQLLQSVRSDVFSFGLQNVPRQFESSFGGKVDSNNSQAALYGYLTVKQMVDALRKCTKGDLACFKDKMLESPSVPEFSFIKFDRNRIARWNVVVWKYERAGQSGHKMVPVSF